MLSDAGVISGYHVYFSSYRLSTFCSLIAYSLVFVCIFTDNRFPQHSQPCLATTHCVVFCSRAVSPEASVCHWYGHLANRQDTQGGTQSQPIRSTQQPTISGILIFNEHAHGQTTTPACGPFLPEQSRAGRKLNTLGALQCAASTIRAIIANPTVATTKTSLEPHDPLSDCASTALVWGQAQVAPAKGVLNPLYVDHDRDITELSAMDATKFYTFSGTAERAFLPEGCVRVKCGIPFCMARGYTSQQ